MTAKPKLFALLVGVDSYLPPITPLAGCVNDVRKVEAYLEGEKEHFDVNIQSLTNSQATKSNIVSGFKNHLYNAKKGDTVLFYFSGHGTQEEADPVFWFAEADKKLESVVCYDSVSQENGALSVNLMADKELRFLIAETGKTRAHIVTIFDCCHSGGNVKNGDFLDVETEGQPQVKRRRLSMAFPQRDWSDFIFSDTISRAAVEEKGLNAVFAESVHLQMAACQNDESAYEVNGAGVFTKNLIEILNRCKGGISYHRLQSIIQGYLRHQFNQTPKIYTTSTDVLFLPFLNKNVTETTLKGSVAYNTSLGWVLDMGSLQGMTVGTMLTLKGETAETYNAKIDAVAVSYSTLSFVDKEETLIPKDAIFETEITDFLSGLVRVYIDPTLEEHPGINTLLSQMEEYRQLHLATDLSTADYSLMKQEDSLILTYPGRNTVPIVPALPLASFGEQYVSTLLSYLLHLSRYAFVRHLSNPAAFMLRPDQIALDVYGEADYNVSLPIENEELKLHYVKKNNRWGGAIKIRLKNTTNQKLYCSLCYLSFNFGVYTKLISTGVVGLQPQAEVWACDGDPIQFVLEPEVPHFGLEESTSYLKLLISTEDFTSQLGTLRLKDLPGPLSAPQPPTKGLQTKSETVHDWTTRLITLRMPNPE